MFQISSKETKVLAVPWNKLTDKLSVSIPKFQQTVIKINILNYVALIHDTLVIMSPCHVLGKSHAANFVMGKFRGMKKLLSILKTSL